MAEVIGFTSGKGGMGKTALCAALAWALACSGRKVLCIDCDDAAGDLDAYLGFGQQPDLTYPEVCRGTYPLDRAASCLSHSNLRFLAAPMRDAQVTQAEMAALLRQARQQFDYILLDDPKFDLADCTCLVTQPNPAAIRGARRKADALEIRGAKNVRLIVNGIDPRQMAALKLNVDDVMDQVGLPLLGIVPLDPEFTLSCAAGQPLRSKKRAGSAMERIARRIQGIQTAIPSRLS